MARLQQDCFSTSDICPNYATYTTHATAAPASTVAACYATYATITGSLSAVIPTASPGSAAAKLLSPRLSRGAA
jgi:hypothetical protein